MVHLSYNEIKEGEKMSFTIKDLLESKEFSDMKLIAGQNHKKNEIKGVTIIEAPDIMHFIQGGELLLTGLYAFKSCSIAEFQGYLQEIKTISGIIIKKGRTVKDAETKIKMLEEYANEHSLPLIQVPFEISFQKIMSFVMEHIFNEEVTHLKYFKTTHDNFTALTLSSHQREHPIKDILDMLNKLIRNPVTLYDRNFNCYAAANDEFSEFHLSKNAKHFDAGMLTKYKYLKQNNQYIIELNLTDKMYLVITETVSKFESLDCIAIENAVIALQYEFSRKQAIAELEKKYQNDIFNNLLNGKIISYAELKRNIELLNMDFNGFYRVLVFGLEYQGRKNINQTLYNMTDVENSILQYSPDVKIYRDMDKIVVIQPTNHEQTQLECKQYISELKQFVEQQNNKLLVKIGVGKMVHGITHIKASYCEAQDALSFIHIMDGFSDNSDILLFSELGIFKLLCQETNPNVLIEYIPESLQKLYNYKKSQQKELITTLKTYLNFNQNLSKTAQSLYVHYKTVAYRIDKISEITGMDFDNPNEMLEVRIGLIIYQMLEKYNNK